MRVPCVEEGNKSPTCLTVVLDDHDALACWALDSLSIWMRLTRRSGDCCWGKDRASQPKPSQRAWDTLSWFLYAVRYHSYGRKSTRKSDTSLFWLKRDVMWSTKPQRMRLNCMRAPSAICHPYRNTRAPYQLVRPRTQVTIKTPME